MPVDRSLSVAIASPADEFRDVVRCFGRALAAPPDALWALGPALADVDFAILPLGDDPTVRRVFDAQIVGIAPGGMHPEWALQLGQLIASSEVVRAILAPSDGQPVRCVIAASP